MSFNAGESKSFKNIAASTAPFTLMGGLYAVAAVATWSAGSVTLQAVGPDGSTLVTVLTAFSANGYSTVYLPPGQYQFTVVTSTAVYVSLNLVPQS